jgi:hypothetical protein
MRMPTALLWVVVVGREELGMSGVVGKRNQKGQLT